MRISVVMPVHDGADFLAPTLRSVLNQTLAPAEVIVVDDGSGDDSAAIAEGFGPPVRVIRGRFGGAAAARVAGVAEATGDAFMFLDADDLLGMDVLQSLAAVLVRRPGTVACCDWMRYERIGATWQARPASWPARRPGQGALAGWLTGRYYPPCAVLWSRAAYARSGGWNPAILVNNDGDLMMRALAHGLELVRSATGTSYYRRLPDGAVSLSGRRFTPAGLASRLTVLDNLADLLERSRYPDGTRPALAEAYGIVAGDAEAAGEPGLAARGREGDAKHGGTGMLSWRRRRADRLRGLERARPAADRPAAAPPAAEGLPPRPAPLCPDGLTVSVIVPTFNRSGMLVRALTGILSQDFADFEVIVIDDASTEDIGAVLRRMDDLRLRHVRQAENRGVAAARNRGIAEARGRLIAFCDSDDEWLPGKLTAQVRVMEDSPPRVGLVYTGLIERGSDGVSTLFAPQDRGDVWREMMHRNVVHYGTSGTMIRREVIETVGGFDETLPAIEDYDFWTRIARFHEFACITDPLMIYHDEAAPDDMTDDRRSRDFDANMAARRMFVDRYGAEGVRAGVLDRSHLDNARRHLESPVGRQPQALLFLAKAIRRRPASPRLYAWLTFALLPGGLRRKVFPGLARMRARLPDWAWTGSGDR